MTGALWVCKGDYNRSLEFVAETRILAEMKIENRGKNFSAEKTNWQAYFFLNSPSV